MLDLKKLEQQLDAALANETPESLTEWLLSQRMAGQETTFEVEAQEVILSVSNETFLPEFFAPAKFVDAVDANVAGLYHYAMAA